MNEAVAALLDLQKVDLARDRLHERKEHLPLRAELVDIEARIAEVKGVMAGLQKQADELEREERRVEEEVRLIEEKIAQEEDKMYSGRVINPKEVAALTDEVAMLRRRKAPLEEKGLEELEERDVLLSERTALEQQVAALESEAGTLRTRIDAAVGEIDTELAVEDDKRASVLGRIPADTLEQYEALRESKRGVGIGVLQNGICSACSEALSAVEVDRIKQRARTGEWLFRCEHCRRLLVLRQQ